MNLWVAVVIALLLGIAIGVAVISLVQQGRTRKLRDRFGPEYERVVTETGSRPAGEARLIERQHRVERLELRSLAPADWRDIQARFVDDPNGALNRADRLISEVMAAQGYPVRDFEQRAEDISVAHPLIVENYREAHGVAVRNLQGRATTEDLRKAMLHYRTLFEELAGQHEWLETERTRT